MRHAIAQTTEVLGVAAVAGGAYLLAGIGALVILAGLALIVGAQRVDSP